jgi:two-component system sensor histidine kinase QseC
LVTGGQVNKSYSLEIRIISVALITLASVWLVGVGVLYFEAMREIEEMAPHFFNLDDGNEHLEELEEVITKTFFYPLIAGLPLMAILLFLVLRKGLEPLREVEKALSRRRPDQMDPIEVEGYPSEISPLVNTLNDLFSRISVAIVREKRLTADAAHELRTPLAGIRANVEALFGSGVALPNSMAEQHLFDLLAGCDRAGHSINQMLELARLEGNRTLSSETSLVNLAEIIRQEVAGVISLSESSGPDVELDLPEALETKTVEPCLRILLRNLVSNAVKFAGPEGRVRLSISSSAEGPYVICIEDSGPGLSKEEIARLGERFFRVHHSYAGAGLGWSIIRRCADILNAELRVDLSDRLTGLRVHVVGRSVKRQLS